ncbi:hypothetical protein BESB_048810 [Besnoitia besnoiti]|uniref:Uncharacterized protein n=1 Tax=Besnoitia besnoiti TaxID=94643 RepID=A0A2A9MFI7_BESBE|nr:hypothetical protein BESB_048810 [Besnoitia besnoiti]PFH36689.1 hypothetical protein BESB_048810 [Besnoitia besnoiti]
MVASFPEPAPILLAFEKKRLQRQQQRERERARREETADARGALSPSRASSAQGKKSAASRKVRPATVSSACEGAVRGDRERGGDREKPQWRPSRSRSDSPRTREDGEPDGGRRAGEEEAHAKKPSRKRSRMDAERNTSRPEDGEDDDAGFTSRRDGQGDRRRRRQESERDSARVGRLPRRDGDDRRRSKRGSLHADSSLDVALEEAPRDRDRAGRRGTVFRGDRATTRRIVEARSSSPILISSEAGHASPRLLRLRPAGAEASPMSLSTGAPVVFVTASPASRRGDAAVLRPLSHPFKPSSGEPLHASLSAKKKARSRRPGSRVPVLCPEDSDALSSAEPRKGASPRRGETRAFSSTSHRGGSSAGLRGRDRELRGDALTREDTPAEERTQRRWRDRDSEADETPPENGVNTPEGRTHRRERRARSKAELSERRRQQERTRAYAKDDRRADSASGARAGAWRDAARRREAERAGRRETFRDRQPLGDATTSDAASSRDTYSRRRSPDFYAGAAQKPAEARAQVLVTRTESGESTSSTGLPDVRARRHSLGGVRKGSTTAVGRREADVSRLQPFQPSSPSGPRRIAPAAMRNNATGAKILVQASGASAARAGGEGRAPLAEGQELPPTSRAIFSHTSSYGLPSLHTGLQPGSAARGAAEWREGNAEGRALEGAGERATRRSPFSNGAEGTNLQTPVTPDSAAVLQEQVRAQTEAEKERRELEARERREREAREKMLQEEERRRQEALFAKAPVDPTSFAFFWLDAKQRDGKAPSERDSLAARDGCKESESGAVSPESSLASSLQTAALTYSSPRRHRVGGQQSSEASSASVPSWSSASSGAEGHSVPSTEAGKQSLSRAFLSPAPGERKASETSMERPGASSLPLFVGVSAGGSTTAPTESRASSLAGARTARLPSAAPSSSVARSLARPSSARAASDDQLRRPQGEVPLCAARGARASEAARTPPREPFSSWMKAHADAFVSSPLTAATQRVFGGEANQGDEEGLESRAPAAAFRAEVAEDARQRSEGGRDADDGGDRHARRCEALYAAMFRAAGLSEGEAEAKARRLNLSRRPTTKSRDAQTRLLEEATAGEAGRGPEARLCHSPEEGDLHSGDRLRALMTPTFLPVESSYPSPFASEVSAPPPVLPTFSAEGSSPAFPRESAGTLSGLPPAVETRDDAEKRRQRNVEAVMEAVNTGASSFALALPPAPPSCRPFDIAAERARAREREREATRAQMPEDDVEDVKREAEAGVNDFLSFLAAPLLSASDRPLTAPPALRACLASLAASPPSAALLRLAGDAETPDARDGDALADAASARTTLGENQATGGQNGVVDVKQLPVMKHIFEPILQAAEAATTNEELKKLVSVFPATAKSPAAHQDVLLCFAERVARAGLRDARRRLESLAVSIHRKGAALLAERRAQEAAQQAEEAAHLQEVRQALAYRRLWCGIRLIADHKLRDLCTARQLLAPLQVELGAADLEEKLRLRVAALSTPEGEAAPESVRQTLKAESVENEKREEGELSGEPRPPEVLGEELLACDEEAQRIKEEEERKAALERRIRLRKLRVQIHEGINEGTQMLEALQYQRNQVLMLAQLLHRAVLPHVDEKGLLLQLQRRRSQRWDGTPERAAAVPASKEARAELSELPRSPTAADGRAGVASSPLRRESAPSGSQGARAAFASSPRSGRGRAPLLQSPRIRDLLPALLLESLPSLPPSRRFSLASLVGERSVLGEDDAHEPGALDCKVPAGLRTPSDGDARDGAEEKRGVGRSWRQTFAESGEIREAPQGGRLGASLLLQGSSSDRPLRLSDLGGGEEKGDNGSLGGETQQVDATQELDADRLREGLVRSPDADHRLHRAAFTGAGHASLLAASHQDGERKEGRPFTLAASRERDGRSVSFLPPPSDGLLGLSASGVSAARRAAFDADAPEENPRAGTEAFLAHAFAQQLRDSRDDEAAAASVRRAKLASHAGLARVAALRETVRAARSELLLVSAEETPAALRGARRGDKEAGAYSKARGARAEALHARGGAEAGRTGEALPRAIKASALDRILMQASLSVPTGALRGLRRWTGEEELAEASRRREERIIWEEPASTRTERPSGHEGAGSRERRQVPEEETFSLRNLAASIRK